MKKLLKEAVTSRDYNMEVIMLAKAARNIRNEVFQNAMQIRFSREIRG